MPTTYAIPNGATVMAATTWTGDGASTLTITNSGNNPTGVTFQPDLVWSKLKSGTASNNLYDSVRGTGKVLYSDTTDPEGTNNTYGYLNAFNSNGFSATAGGTSIAYFNTNTSTYVAWQWKAGGAAVSNTAGSITSQVSANTTAGFSVVSFNSGTAGNKTVGHGLGVTPSLIITKNRDAVASWAVWSSSFSNTAQGYLLLNGTGGVTDDSRQWANTAPTPTVFSFESGYSFTASNNIVAYCWAEVAGYSKAFTYTGNSSSDGAFVYLGFRPRYILHKNTASSQWMIWDTSRSPYNVLTNQELLANSANAQGTGAWGTEIDILSNGFKFRGYDNANFNYSGNTYIGFAFAENPFKYANAR